VLKNSKEGVLVGSARFLPCFLNFEPLMNPHIFICGVTGSGKTYLMKSLMLRLSVVMDSLVIVIDFTGEYKSFVELVGLHSRAIEDLPGAIEKRARGIVHFDLGGIKQEGGKVDAADKILAGISEGMRDFSKSSGRRVFVVLDEAWKLLGSSRPLEAILREGRKYGHGLIFSSQLIEDVDMSMLSNAATLFAFRLQNRQSLDGLARNYNMTEEEIARIQNQNVGSCVIVQTNALNKRSLLFVEKVAGIVPATFLKIRTDDSMEIEVSRKRFESEISSICDSAQASRIVHGAEEAGYVELVELIKELIGDGISRGRVLDSIRGLGIKDREIADAFASAVSGIAGDC
jgi:DNA helicase HerA-like ATPase